MRPLPERQLASKTPEKLRTESAMSVDLEECESLRVRISYSGGEDKSKFGQ